MMRQYKYNNPLLISLLFHAAILAVLVISLEFRSKTYVLENSKDNQVISAVVLDSSKVQMPDPATMPKLKKLEEPQKILPTPAAKSTPQPVKKVVEKPQVQTKAIIIPTKKKLIPKNLIQKQLLDDIKKETETKKKTKQVDDLEKAFEKELKNHKAAAIQQQFLKEKDHAASAQSQKMQGIVNKYKALILQAIAQYWIVPNGANPNLSSELLIRVAPGGSVLDVQIVRSSGDDALDRSARSAVFKASPLPVPANSDEFEPFREFILKVKPENILARDNGLG